MSIKNIILGLIIAVIFLMFAVYGTKLVYDAPEYEDFCDEFKPVPLDRKIAEEIIQEMEECRNDWNSAQEDYFEKIFIISLIFSIVVIIASILLVHVEAVAGGLMLGSLFFIIYGTWEYWRYMNDWLRFIILGVALIILIYAGYWLANKESKKK
jgi:small-conductance mechanosensitive channel